MTSSYYSWELWGSTQANGEPFEPLDYTAAHKTLPLDTGATVCSLEGHCVDVTIEDRGPYIDGRDLDLSLGAADAIGITDEGVDTVEVYLWE